MIVPCEINFFYFRTVNAVFTTASKSSRFGLVLAITLRPFIVLLKNNARDLGLFIRRQTTFKRGSFGQYAKQSVSNSFFLTIISKFLPFLE